MHFINCVYIVSQWQLNDFDLILNVEYLQIHFIKIY